MYEKPPPRATPPSINPDQHNQFALLLVTGLAAVLLFTALIPHRSRAFWPFSTNASAQTLGLPSSQTPTLEAATNADPNPNKGLADVQTSGNMALVAYSGPAGTIADITDSTKSDRISVYVVRPGDTLSDIADMFEVSINTILWANNLKNAKDVHPGDTLIILPVSGVKRVVQKGDTLRSLAKKYGGDAEEIATFNGLDGLAPLVVGSTIIIPGGEIVAAPTPRTSGPSVVGTVPVQVGYYSNPVPGSRITQGLHGHNGIDFGGAPGTPIHASANGTVIIARNSGWNGGYGNYVVVTHGNGTQTLYAHMINAIVTPGQSVVAGQVIGYMGRSGLATGTHLHFEVRGTRNPFAR